MIKRYIAVLGLAALCSIGSSYANEAPGKHSSRQRPLSISLDLASSLPGPIAILEHATAKLSQKLRLASAGNDCAFNFFYSVPFGLSVTVTRKPGAEEEMKARNVKVRRLSQAILAVIDEACNSGVEEEATTNPNFKPLYVT